MDFLFASIASAHNKWRQKWRNGFFIRQYCKRSQKTIRESAGSKAEKAKLVQEKNVEKNQ